MFSRLTHEQTPWYQVSVRQASALPTASFRPNVAIGTLLSAVRLPLLGRVGDLHPLDYTHVGRTTARGHTPIRAHPLEYHKMLKLWDEEGGEFGQAAGVEAFVELASVVTVGGVGFEDVAVARF